MFNSPAPVTKCKNASGGQNHHGSKNSARSPVLQRIGNNKQQRRQHWQGIPVLARFLLHSGFLENIIQLLQAAAQGRHAAPPPLPPKLVNDKSSLRRKPVTANLPPLLLHHSDIRSTQINLFSIMQGWASFFSKERNILAFFSILYKRTERFLRSFRSL